MVPDSVPYTKVVYILSEKKPATSTAQQALARGELVIRPQMQESSITQPPTQKAFMTCQAP